MIVRTCPACAREVVFGEEAAADAARCPNCAAHLGEGPPFAAPPTAALSNGAAPPAAPTGLGHLGPYRLLQELGQGGMGTVYRAVDTVLGRQVAVKVMLPALAAHPTSRERFLREARAVAALHHDNIIVIHHVGEHDGVPYLVMPLLEGESLADRLHRERPLPIHEVLYVGRAVAKGLAAAHAQGQIHRDIKPANIWLERIPEPGTKFRVKQSDGTLLSIPHRVLLLDFGLARGAGERQLTHAGALLGTPGYMAPEQARGERADARSDLFSLGCVLYQMAVGVLPFRGDEAPGLHGAATTETPPLMHQRNPKVPPALSTLVARLLANNAAERPASAAAVSDELKALLENLGQETARQSQETHRRQASETRPPGGRAPAAWRPKAAVVAGIGLIVAAVVLAVVAGRLPGGKQAGATQRAPRPTFRGVTDTEIKLGLTAPFSGPNQAVGRAIQVGLDTYLKHVNDQGGVHGRKLSLVVLDDAYEPPAALRNIKILLEEKRIFAAIGNVGTPTVQVTLPYLADKDAILFGAFTGANVLRTDPPTPWIFNYRASYEQETARLVAYLLRVRNLRPDQIAVFAQQEKDGAPDTYGRAGYEAVVKALRRHDGPAAAQVPLFGHVRNSAEGLVPAAQAFAEQKNLRAVILATAHKSAALFIHEVRKARPDVIFANLSIIGSTGLAEELKQYGPQTARDIVAMQVVPPIDSESMLVSAYRQHLKQYYEQEQPSFSSLEAYIDLAIFVEGLKRAGDDLNTATLIKALESIRNHDIGLGAPISFGPADHQASDKVWGTRLNEQFQFEEVSLE